jgi:hypothetical protein
MLAQIDFGNLLVRCAAGGPIYARYQPPGTIYWATTDFPALTDLPALLGSLCVPRFVSAVDPFHNFLAPALSTVCLENAPEFLREGPECGG